MKKVAIIGPESTGKSTLCAALAERFGAPWVPEYARQYLEQLEGAYTEDDLLAIARGQLAGEDRVCAASGASLVFCDTDLYVIKVWSEHKFGCCDPWILQEISCRPYDLYLLTAIDLPWSEDPQREHPEPRMREYFFRQYLDIVLASGVPWALIEGDATSRLALAERAVGKLGK